MRSGRTWLTLLALLAACSTGGPRALMVGQSEADALKLMGQPTNRYTMPGGGTRLEFATGPMGRETWMVDLGPDGRVLAADQVLDVINFRAVQPGMTREELLRTLGRPGETRSGGRQGGQVWSYRYPNNDCLWFQVSLDDAGRVLSGTFGNDPRCDIRVR